MRELAVQNAVRDLIRAGLVKSAHDCSRRRSGASRWRNAVLIRKDCLAPRLRCRPTNRRGALSIEAQSRIIISCEAQSRNVISVSREVSRSRRSVRRAQEELACTALRMASCRRSDLFGMHRPWAESFRWPVRSRLIRRLASFHRTLPRSRVIIPPLERID